MKRIRVGLLIGSMRGGGSERQTLLLLSHLDRERFEPTLIVSEAVGDLMEKVPDDVAVKAFGLPSDDDNGSFFGWGARIPGAAFRRWSCRLADVVRSVRPDVLYDRTLTMTRLAASAVDPARLPRVSTLVSPPSMALPHLEKRYVYWKRRSLRQAYLRSRFVIAVSDAVAEDACRYYDIESARIETINNPVDISRIQTDSMAGDSDGNFHRRECGDRVSLVCVGRMSNEKGQSTLLEALRRLQTRSDIPPLRLTLVGDGPDRRKLEVIARMIDRHHVEFVGQIANPLPLIRNADALISPSRFEGSPNVVLEAFALRTPVIASRGSGAETFANGNATMRLFDVDDAESLSLQIVDLIQRHERTDALSNAASEYLLAHHDVSRCVGRIERLLSDAATHSAG